jgi:hypothetical protein
MIVELATKNSAGSVASTSGFFIAVFYFNNLFNFYGITITFLS